MNKEERELLSNLFKSIVNKTIKELEKETTSTPAQDQKIERMISLADRLYGSLNN